MRTAAMLAPVLCVHGATYEPRRTSIQALTALQTLFCTSDRESPTSSGGSSPYPLTAAVLWLPLGLISIRAAVALGGGLLAARREPEPLRRPFFYLETFSPRRMATQMVSSSCVAAPIAVLDRRRLTPAAAPDPGSRLLAGTGQGPSAWLSIRIWGSLQTLRGTSALPSNSSPRKS